MQFTNDHLPREKTPVQMLADLINFNKEHPTPEPKTEHTDEKSQSKSPKKRTKKVYTTPDLPAMETV
jgi:hypothetical protein